MRKHLFFYLIFFLPFLTFGQNWDEIIKLQASDASGNSYFGYSVAIEGETAVVGAYQKNFIYIFKKQEGNWVEHQKILTPNYDPILGSNDQFGVKVAINGDYIVVGAPNHSLDADGEEYLLRAGAVFIFKLNDTQWEYQQKVVAENRRENGNFGLKLAIDSDFIIVGYQNDKSVSDIFPVGSVSVFKRSGDVYNQHQIITASDSVSDGLFGRTVDISKERFIVGSARNSIGESDIVYIYNLEQDIWVEKQKIFGDADSVFGQNSIAIDNNYIVVGAHRNGTDANGENPITVAGSAYVFVHDGNNWVQQAKLVASDRGAGDFFGASVDIKGDFIVVGSYFEDDDVNGNNPVTDAGSAYIFKRNGTTWQQSQKIVASDRVQNDYFGFSVAIDKQNAIVGAYRKNGYQGNAYVFGLNCNTLSPVANNIQKFEQGDTLSDLEVEAEGELKWYADETLNIVLPDSTPLVDSTTYYVTQTLDGCESQATSITVQKDENLNVFEKDSISLISYPNPVKDFLYFKSSKELFGNIQVYDMSGKILLSSTNNSISKIDLRELKAGSYVIKVSFNQINKTFKIIKK